MKSNEIVYSKWASRAGPVALLAAAGAAGVWMWQTQGASAPLRSAVGLAALAAVFAAVWLYRLRAARRLFTVLNAYAEQELDRAQRRTPTSFRKSNRRFSRSSV